MRILEKAQHNLKKIEGRGESYHKYGLLYSEADLNQVVDHRISIVVAQVLGTLAIIIFLLVNAYKFGYKQGRFNNCYLLATFYGINISHLLI